MILVLATTCSCLLLDPSLKSRKVFNFCFLALFTQPDTVSWLGKEGLVRSLDKEVGKLEVWQTGVSIRGLGDKLFTVRWNNLFILKSLKQ